LVQIPFVQMPLVQIPFVQIPFVQMPFVLRPLVQIPFVDTNACLPVAVAVPSATSPEVALSGAVQPVAAPTTKPRKPRMMGERGGNFMENYASGRRPLHDSTLAPRAIRFVLRLVSFLPIT